MAPRELPQARQKARLEESEDLKVAGAPAGPVQCTWALGNSTQARVRAPLWRWHNGHEQVWGLLAGPRASKRTWPHRQPP